MEAEKKPTTKAPKKPTSKKKATQKSIEYWQSSVHLEVDGRKKVVDGVVDPKDKRAFLKAVEHLPGFNIKKWIDDEPPFDPHQKVKRG